MFFFFSSRRRHTRYWRDWSSDVCSSDLRTWAEHALGIARALPGSALELASPVLDRLRMVKTPAEVEELAAAGAAIDRVHARMAEWLRVGRTEAEVGADVATAILDRKSVV